MNTFKEIMNPILSTNKILYLCILSVGFSISCKDTTTSTIISLPIEENIGNFKTFKLTNIDGDLEYVVLETNKECLFERISHIDISTNYILIRGGTSGVFLFDREGNFLRKIGNYGRGPGEYYLTGHVKIYNDKIFIPDALDDKLFVYNTNGIFIKTINSPGGFTTESQLCNWFPLTDSTFLAQIPNDTGQEKNRISLFNEKGEILYEYPNTTFFKKEQEFWSTIDKAGHFYSIDGKIRYKEEFVDTLWQVDVTRKQLVPKYNFELGKFSFPTELRGVRDKPRDKVMGAIVIKRIFELDEYLIFESVFRKHYPFNFREQLSYGGIDRGLQYGIIGIYNKTNNELFFVDASNVSEQPEPTGIVNDVDGEVNFFPKYSKDANLLVSWVEPYKLKSYIKSQSFKNSTPKYPEKKKELEQLANSLDENDNPVLMLVKLKE